MLRHPLALKDEELNDPRAFAIHRRIVEDKPFLERWYEDSYRDLLRPFDRSHRRRIVEIGSGSCNSNLIDERIITTDLLPNEFVTLAADAHSLPFRDGALDGIILLNALHHLPSPRMFFSEVARCLRAGGEIVMREPYFSPWGRFVYERLHHESVYDCPEWELPAQEKGRLSGANSRTPFNIFVRDRERFETEYPELIIEDISLGDGFIYIVSGGLSWKPLAPAFSYPLFAAAERILQRWGRLLATSMTIRLSRSPRH
jgi:SAM-dependent methyltransferase